MAKVIVVPRWGWRIPLRPWWTAQRATQFWRDQFGQLAAIVAEEVPAAVFGIGFRQAIGCRLQAFEGGFIEIGQKTTPECLLLPDHETGQRDAGQGGESQKKALPEAQVHCAVAESGLKSWRTIARW